MSRDYLIKIFFDKPYPRDKLNKFFAKWCGQSQILRIGNSSVMCEMGCSSGISPEETMNELYNQLIKAKLLVSKEDIIAWSLHPDEAITIGEEHD